MSPTKASNSTLRQIPSIDQLLRSGTAAEMRKSVGSKQLTGLARSVIGAIRDLVRSGGEVAGEPPEKHTTASLLAEAERRLVSAFERERLTGLTRVINATGVVLHTNLGRAPLSDETVKAIQQAARYCNLEYDTASGSRGRRGVRVESLVKALTGAEDALVVNNCASAALLILTVLAKGGETIVSRGELVEIGGDFRIPDVMATSGTRMVEVGTTNRTSIDDYRLAITGDTRLLMRVHPSNYRIVGFASSPSLSQLVDLAREVKLPLYEDAGSGQLNEMIQFGVTDEFGIKELVRVGADVISFSGDKLLGSAQAGVIVGKAEIVNRLRKHPLYRALRVDKLRLAALQASLESYQKAEEVAEIPTLHMISLTQSEIRARAQRILDQLQSDEHNNLLVSLKDDLSAIGGGAAPTTRLETTVISLGHCLMSAEQLERCLRTNQPPIIGRISEGHVLLDLRTVYEDEEPALVRALQTIKTSGLTALASV